MISRNRGSVLLVCTVPSLESYSIGIIKAALNCRERDFYVFVFTPGADVRSEDQLLQSYGISAVSADRIKFCPFSENKIIRNISSGRYLGLVLCFAEEHQIKQVHFISQDVILHGHLAKFKKLNLYYTVHDLVPHQAKLNPFQRLKHYYFRVRKDQCLIRTIQNLVTNSQHQKRALEELYPNKNILWHAMPSLVTPAIRSGRAFIKELQNQDGYVLFFGKIEYYKGLENLYHAFLKDPALKNKKLVIAGSGKIYFTRQREYEENVIWINRFIAEQEIAHLFTNASLLVLPYLNATQSAVSSLAYHYGLPVIASDIPGLRETIQHQQTGILYPPHEQGSLANAITNTLNDPHLITYMRNFIRHNGAIFDSDKLSVQLSRVYK